MNKKKLYNSIMESISKQIKKALNETIDFNNSDIFGNNYSYYEYDEKNTNVYKEGKNSRWSQVQYEEGKNGNYSTLAPSGKYKYSALTINEDSESISLMEFDDFKDMIDEFGWDASQYPDLDGMHPGEEKTFRDVKYIKIM